MAEEEEAAVEAEEVAVGVLASEEVEEQVVEVVAEEVSRSSDEYDTKLPYWRPTYYPNKL